MLTAALLPVHHIIHRRRHNQDICRDQQQVLRQKRRQGHQDALRPINRHHHGRGEPNRHAAEQECRPRKEQSHLHPATQPDDEVVFQILPENRKKGCLLSPFYRCLQKCRQFPLFSRRQQVRRQRTAHRSQ